MGRDLPARMETHEDAGAWSVRLVLDDTAATYPLTIDPLTTTAAWGTESDQANAHYGRSVAFAGDVNGDGYDDVLVGLGSYDHGQEDEGRALLYLGGTSTVPAGWVPADAPLELALRPGDLTLSLNWAPSCLGSDIDYEVYEGVIGDFTSHQARLCSTEGQTSAEFLPRAESTYYLVVPRSGPNEGSYGQASDGTERPPGGPACLLQSIGECEAG